MREVELKFRVNGPFALPDLTADGTGVRDVRKQRRVVLRATYYDTEDLRLAREGVTLRRRTGGGADGWQLKLPVAGEAADTRDEIEAAPTGSDVPEQLTDLVTALVRSAPLQPVAKIVTTRDTWVLVGEDDEELAELVDDSVAVLDSGHVGTRFREIELEARSADRAALGAIGAQLQTAGAVAGEFVPKLVRALGERATAGPLPPEPEKVRPRDQVGRAVEAFLRTTVRRLLVADVSVRRADYDSVHQMRVATRRLRSGLQSFAGIVDEEWAKRLRGELAWLGGALGPVRDGEVFEACVADLLDKLEKTADDVAAPQADRLIRRRLREQVEAARAELLSTLRTPRYVTLLDDLVAGAIAPLLTPEAERPSGEVLRDLATKSWRRLDRAMLAIGPKSPDAKLHRARILAKRARYAADLSIPVFGDAPTALSARLADLQDVLGAHQDAVVAGQRLQDLARAPRVGGEAGFLLGILFRMTRSTRRAARRSLDQAWSAARAPKLRHWLKS